MGCPIGLIHDVIVRTCQLPVVQGDTEASFIPFHKHFHQCWEPFCLDRWKYPNTRTELCTINMTGTFTRWFVISCVWTAASRTSKNLMVARNTSCHHHQCHVSFTLQPVELRICYKITKLAVSISEARAGQSACCLSSFLQWTTMSSSICPLRGNGENIQRHRDQWCWYSARLESGFKRKNVKYVGTT